MHPERALIVEPEPTESASSYFSVVTRFTREELAAGRREWGRRSEAQIQRGGHPFLSYRLQFIHISQSEYLHTSPNA